MTHHLVVTHTRDGITRGDDLGVMNFDDTTRGLAAVFDALLAELAHPAHDASRASHWTFRLTGASVDGDDADEHLIYGWASLRPELYHRLTALVRATEVGAHGHRPWADDEHPTGSAAIFTLVTAHNRYIPEYIRYLRTCDLDHEVDQYQQIDDIIELYGWNNDTLALVAARLGQCVGQAGAEQVAELLGEADLAGYAATPKGRRRLAAAVERELDRDDEAFQRLLALPPGAFDARVQRYLLNLSEVLGEYLSDETLSAVKERAERRWSDNASRG